jgi:hypothetical protein
LETTVVRTIAVTNFDLVHELKDGLFKKIDNKLDTG